MLNLFLWTIHREFCKLWRVWKLECTTCGHARQRMPYSSPSTSPAFRVVTGSLSMKLMMESPSRQKRCWCVPCRIEKAVSCAAAESMITYIVHVFYMYVLWCNFYPPMLMFCLSKWVSKLDIAFVIKITTALRDITPHGITQCYLPPGRGDLPTFTQTEASTQFSEPKGCKAELTWVVVISQDSLPAKYVHLSQK